MTATPLRWILHLDMDAFYASVEQLDNPELRGRPLIVGGGERGVVSTCSYEARAFGVRSAMPLFQARKLCPRAVFLPVRMERYKEKSREVMAVLDGFSPLVEQASVDEAYVDLTGLERIFGGAAETARAVRDAVREKTGLSCSVGLAPVKFLAKIASDMNKPGGLTVLLHADVPAFLEKLPAGRIPGVGRQTLAQLESLGMRTAADVARQSAEFWSKRLGKAGEALYDRARGIDGRPVRPVVDPKSESAENTFARDTLDREILAAWLLRQAERVGESLRRRNLAGRTITLKVKYGDFVQVTRARTLKRPTNLTRPIYETALELLEELNPARPLRLIGVGVSHFGEGERQFSLLPEPEEEDRQREARLDNALDELRRKFGRGAVVRGKLFRPPEE